jgi:DNA-binding MarR family transcriptional regulator
MAARVGFLTLDPHVVTASMATATKRIVRATPATKPSPIGKRRAAEPDALAEFDLIKDSLGYAIKLAQVRTYEMLYKALGPNTLSPARMTALSIVATESGISQSALADRLRITRPSVVKVVDTLESLGLVARQPGSDRRSYALALTPRGLKELREIQVRLRGYEQAITQRMTTSERNQLMELLAKVA